MDIIDYAFSNTLFYLGVGFLLLGFIFGIIAAFQRDNARKKRLYLQGFWIFFFAGVVLLFRDTKLSYLEAFARRLL